MKNKILKNTITVFKHAGIITLLTGVVLHSAYTFEILHGNTEYDSFISWLKKDIVNKPKPSKPTAVPLSSNEEMDTLINLSGIRDLLHIINSQYVRFEAMQNTPIYIVVDENKCADTVKDINSIKNAISNFNEIFAEINPDYSFEYVSEDTFNNIENSDNLPNIQITFANRIHNKHGEELSGIITNLDGTPSEYDNGLIDRNNKIILSKNILEKHNTKGCAAIIMHELSHALGVTGNSDDYYSILNPNHLNTDNISTTPSSDLLLSLVSLYYNPQTSEKTYVELLNYINACQNLRVQEIDNNPYIEI